MANFDTEILMSSETDKEAGSPLGASQAPETRGLPNGLRFVKPAIWLGVGAILGVVLHATAQEKITLPTETEANHMNHEEFKALMENKVSLTEFVGTVQNDLRCEKIPCGKGSTCCRNDLGANYCCAPGNMCAANVCLLPGAYCFAGEASLEVMGQGATAIKDVKIGDRVLVQNTRGALDYEAVLGFLHAATKPGELSAYLSVTHSHGKLQVSPNHIVFRADGVNAFAGHLKVGDELLVARGDGKVLDIEHSVGNSGMFAPLTAFGTVVVDGVVASNYAIHSTSVWVPHHALHAAFFPLRAYYALGFSSAPMEQNVDQIHPFASFLLERVSSPAMALFGIK